MRYRKNKKFSALLFPPGCEVLPYNCSLNQSPWDAIPLSTDSDSNFDLDCRPYFLQFERDSRFDRDANNSNARSIDREPKAASDKVAGAGDNTQGIIIKERTTEETEEIEEKGLRPRSQRRAAKKARWLNSSTNEFYYYSDLGL